MERNILWGCRCQRCKHEWLTRGEEEPKVCPRCKSPYWDTPKIRFIGKVGKFDSEEVFFPKDGKIFGTVQAMKTDLFYCIFSFSPAPDMDPDIFIEYAYNLIVREAMSKKCKYFILEWVEASDSEIKLIKNQEFRLMEEDDFRKVGIIKNHPSWKYYIKDLQKRKKKNE